MTNLGVSYRDGKGVRKSFVKAFQWFNKAAAGGDIDAMWSVATAYKDGKGVKKDNTQKFAWIKKLAEAGNADAMDYLGDYYRSGDGVMQNYAKAIEWYQKAAKEGNLESMCSLGHMYAAGEGVEQDLDKGIKWMKKSAKAGHVHSMYLLGLMYNKKRDESTDPQYDDLTEKWLEKAAEAGHEDAQEKLDEYRDEGSSFCFITTAVCNSFGKPDDCYELTAFRHFRDTWLLKQPDGKSLIAEYYSIAPKIVKRINKAKSAKAIYKGIWQKYLEPCLGYIEQGENSKCKAIYVSMVNSLRDKFL